MGGFGSGPRRWGGKKRTVESCDSLDTADLRRWGMLKPDTSRSGTFTWRHGADPESSSAVGYALSVEERVGMLWLDYQFRSTGRSFRYPVQLVATACQFGGVRWWFVCPLTVDGMACGRRVRKLYRQGDYFGCRRCHRLTYASTQGSDKRVYAAIKGGLDLAALGDLKGRSVAELGFLLKVLTHQQRKVDRIGKQLRA